jgi:FlaA1/EpsC-like NDP-sugar epimerase
MVVNYTPRATAENRNSALREAGGNRVSLTVISVYMRVVDVLISIVSGFLCFQAYLGNAPWADPNKYWAAIAFCIFLQLNIFQTYGIYRTENILIMRRQINILSGAWLTTFLILVFFAFLSKTSEDFSRVWMLLWFGSAWLCFLLSRTLLRRCPSPLKLAHYLIETDGGFDGSETVFG